MKEVIGNIFDHAKTGIIAHGVNCQGKYGKGIALQIAERWPIAKSKYTALIAQTLEMHPRFLMGQVDIVLVEKDLKLYVANCFTQQYYGNSGKYVSYDALDSCMRELADQELPVHMPLIGAGLAGGAPSVCREIITSAFAKRNDCFLYHLPV